MLFVLYIVRVPFSPSLILDNLFYFIFSQEMTSVATAGNSATTMNTSKFCEKKSNGLLHSVVSQAETGFGYIWLAVQTLFLVAALFVVQCSTASVIVCYLFNGKFMKKRGEFFPRDW